MNWNNINLESSYELAQPVIDSLNLETLLLEVDCNLRDKTEATIMAQFETDLQSRIISAREVMQANIKNIVKHANL
jgi:hypothetical protein